MSQSVKFEIDRLTLHGFSVADKNRFLAALQTQLMDLGQRGDIDPSTAAAELTTRVQAASAGRR